MDQKPPRLTTAFIKSIDRPGRWGDGRGGNGLSIVAYANAGGGINRAWSQRILVDGEQRTFGLGRWPNISPTVARKRAYENIRQRDLGENVREPKRQIPTLGEASTGTSPTMPPNGHAKAIAERKRSHTDGAAPGSTGTPYSPKRSPRLPTMT